MAPTMREASMPGMSLHAPRVIRALVGCAVIVALAVTLSGCGTRGESSLGSPRVVSPGMSESCGSPLLFQESRVYVRNDLR